MKYKRRALAIDPTLRVLPRLKDGHYVVCSFPNDHSDGIIRGRHPRAVWAWYAAYRAVRRIQLSDSWAKYKGSMLDFYIENRDFTYDFTNFFVEKNK